MLFATFVEFVFNLNIFLILQALLKKIIHVWQQEAFDAPGSSENSFLYDQFVVQGSIWRLFSSIDLFFCIRGFDMPNWFEIQSKKCPALHKDLSEDMPQLEQIEAIEKRLWSSADNLRANSNYASNEYFMPVNEENIHAFIK